MRVFMSRKQMTSWERYRRHGRFRFILIYGVLLWGSLSALIWMGLTWLRAGYGYLAVVLSSQPLVLPFAFVLGGLIFGFLVWEFNEIRYKHTLEDGRAAE
jgi:hypothetical protein